MSSAPAIKAVVFDLDGLMFNTEEVFNRSGRVLLRRRGKEMTDEILSQMMGRRAHEAFAIMIEMLGLDESVEDLMNEEDEIFRELLDTHLAPMPGLFELLQHIEERSLPKGVATSSDRTYLEDILRRFDLLPRFHVTLAADDVVHGKPHPEIYLKAAQCIGVVPSEMLVLEDSEAGTKAAAAAGAVVVSIPHQHSRTHDFSAATIIAESLHSPPVIEMLDF